MSTDRDLRVNEQIQIASVRLIDAEGHQVGIMPTAEALVKARETGLDLVEVAPNSSPPVCRILDYGKFKYEQKKRKHQKKVHQAQMKEVRVRPKTDTHDIEVKVRRAREFLSKKHKVRFDVMFRGREMAFTNRGRQMLLSIIDMLEDVAKVERLPEMEGRRLCMILAQKAATDKEEAGSESRKDEGGGMKAEG